MGKKTGKPVLMPPFDLSWPKIDKDTENKISTALLLKLQEFPRLGNKRRTDGGNTSGESAAIPRQNLSPQDEENLKARLRQQVVIGFRQVSKALDRNQLALVLVSGMQPPVLLRSLFMLTASRKCAALCFPSLHPWLTDAIGIDNMLAVGFKKAQPSISDDFTELISMATALSPSLSLPGCSTAASEGDTTHPAADGASSVEGIVEEEKTLKSTSEKSSLVKDWLVLEPEQEQEVLSDLLELFIPYESVYQVPKYKLSGEGLAIREKVESLMLTNLEALNNAVQNDELDLLLLHSDYAAHRPRRPHPLATAVAKAAEEKGCPILHMTSLRDGVGTIVKGNPVRAVGFAKSQYGNPPPVEIQQFINMATQYIPLQIRISTSSQWGDGSSAKKGENTTSGLPPNETNRSPPTSACDLLEPYEYNRKDEDKNVPNAAADVQQKGEAYISLSSEPTVQYLGVRSLSDGAPIPGSAFVEEEHSKTHEAEQSMDGESGTEFVGVMGLDAVDTCPPVARQLYFGEPRRKKPKANQKHASDESADRGEFVSFEVQHADIRVCVPNHIRNKKNKSKKDKE